MDVDLTRMPTGTAGWCGLVDHALALGDLSEVHYLELKGTLPFAARPDRKRSAVVVARAVLGLANRMPDLAEKYLGGHGVVLVGVEGQRIVGAEQLDGAVLHDALEPYLGDDGPHWDYVFINHPGGLVLAVVVDPPAWGDRIHACRKEYAAEDGSVAVRDGEVLVRLPGKTRPATSGDLADLERRRDRSPHRGAQVNVEYGGHFDRVGTSSIIDLIEDVVDKTADSMLAKMPRTVSTSPYSSALASFAVYADRRSPEGFRSSVEEWRTEAHGKATAVARDFLRHELARGRWTIHNKSDRYLEAVRAQLDLPSSVVVLMASDTDYCDHGGQFNFHSLLPDPPLEWGRSGLHDVSAYLPHLTAAGSPSALIGSTEFEVDTSTHGTRVTWHVGDLRPRGTELGGELFALVTDDHLEGVQVRWQVTARGVDHVFEGESTIACSQEPGAHLTWTRTPPTTLDESD